MALIEKDSTPITLMANGEPPPFLIPFCASCDMPVEEFTFYPSQDPELMCFEARCHGRTQAWRLSIVEADWRHRTQNHLVLFKRKEGFDRVR